MSQNRKRLLMVFEILRRETNIDHPLAANDIIRRLKEEGLQADRRAIYEDVRTLIDSGYDISIFEENNKGYYLRETEFEFSELRLLTDAILSAKFISKPQSKQIVNKLKRLTNKYDENRLEKVNYLHKRIKCDNNAIFYNIDILTEAIETGRQVRFNYLKYTFSRVLEKKDSQDRIVSPYHIIWINEYYYLVCKYAKYESFTHFRLDKISNIKILDNRIESMEEILRFKNGFDIVEYANQHIHMFSGKEELIELKCRNDVLQILQDKFGDDMRIKKFDNEHFTAVIKSALEGMLFFVLQMADNVEVVSPASFRLAVKDRVESISKIYA